MSVNKVVYCNICPLKELCPHSRPDDAYWWSRSIYAPRERAYASVEHADECAAKCDYGALQQATSLCPLRALL